MVCPRCIMAVEEILKRGHIIFKCIKLGEIEIEKELSDDELQSLSEALSTVGFELLDDQRKQLIEKVKIAAYSKSAKVILKNISSLVNFCQLKRLNIIPTYQSFLPR